MAKRLVSVDEKYMLPAPLETRLEKINQAYTDANKWARPVITSGNLDATMSAGVYDVTSVANTTGWPVNTIGELTVMGKTYPMQSYTTWDSVPRTYVRRYVSNAWSAWQPLTWRHPYLLAGADLDSITAPGVYGFATNGLLNLPPGCGANGILEVLPPSSTTMSQRVTDWSTGNQWHRRRTAGGTWYGWAQTGGDIAKIQDDATKLTARVKAVEDRPAGGGSTPTENDSNPHQHLMRETDLRRRIGPISTGNKAAIALIFDHGTVNFESIVLPLLKKYNMRATLALNADMMNPQSQEYANEVKDWGKVAGWYQSGIEIANHTNTHTNASGTEQMRAEIIGGREALESALNGASTTDAVIYVDSFVQPGTRTATIPTGKQEDAYDGFADGASIEKYYTKTAGKLIIDGHACVSGNVPHWGQVYPLDGTIQIGSNGKWLDSGQAGIDAANTMIDDAIAKKGRSIIRSHPGYVNNGSNITSTQLDNFLSGLAAKRDAGKLIILPFREWNLATI